MALNRALYLRLKFPLADLGFAMAAVLTCKTTAPAEEETGAAPGVFFYKYTIPQMLYNILSHLTSPDRVRSHQSVAVQPADMHIAV